MIKYKINTLPRPKAVPEITAESVKTARRFHESFGEYRKTPLVSLRQLADFLGVGEIYIKDEGKRFGLNAFKVLGASYAMGKYVAERAGLNEFTLDDVKRLVKSTGQIRFYAATDGNHGRAVAWTARKLGCPAEIYMPVGSSAERLENIRALGADAFITDMNYDDTVRFVAEKARNSGGVVIQDTAWQGYEKIPRAIMEGYGVIADEVMDEIEMPTHVFLQAGVGSFAGGMAGCIASLCKRCGKKMPKIIVAESDKADCYYRSAMVNTGEIVVVGGEMKTLMAGLACGEPNPEAFEILMAATSCFLSCDDKIAADGMRMLGSMGLIIGESGAVTCGALTEICLNMPRLRSMLGLDEGSRVLLIGTEGDTDKKRYRDIVWFGRSCL